MNADWFERAMAKTTKNPETGCWEFGGCLSHNGYALSWHEKVGRHTRLHRRSYQEHTGEIPAGIFVCHHCDVRNCWNPEHLFLGTAYDNVRDMLSKGRQRYVAPPKGIRPNCLPPPEARRGENNHFSKLKEREVLSIRALHSSGRSVASIASEYRVNESAVRKIITGETWAHLLPVEDKEFEASQNPPQGEQRPSLKTPSSHLQTRSRTNQGQRRQIT